MGWRVKTLTIYSILILAIYGGGFSLAAVFGAFDNEVVVKEEKPRIELPAINEARAYRSGGVNYVEVEQSFHDYIIVENKYVLHVANCKCKTKKNVK